MDKGVELWNDKPVSLKLFSMVGVQLFGGMYPNGNIRLALPPIAPGIYKMSPPNRKWRRLYGKNGGLLK